MNYIVSPLVETDVHIDVAEFLAKLQADWPDAEIQEPTLLSDPFLIHWSLQNKGYRQLGNLYPDRLSISLEGIPVAAVVFALWYRAFVPAECNLFLYDQGFNDHVELTASSTETQLLAALKIV